MYIYIYIYMSIQIYNPPAFRYLYVRSHLPIYTCIYLC